MTRLVELGVRPATAGSAPVVPEPPERGSRRADWLRGGLPILLLAVAAVVARLPLLTRPLSPDEGGFLMVAAQWAPGTSLYGNYWVDRPPLLVAIFQVAGLLGHGTAGLRLLGAGFVVASVLLAAALGRAVARVAGHGRSSRAPVFAAATAAALLVSPLFGSSEIDGELLAVPFAIAGLAAALTGYAARSRRALLWWAAAGALGAAAAAVKQNMLEVFVAAVVLLGAALLRRRSHAVRSAAAFVAGAAVATAAMLGWAALHGTSPAGLWDAIVTFRFDASATIARSAPSTAQHRALGVAGAFLASGAVGVAAVALLPALHDRTRRRPSLLTVLTAAVLAWELIAAAAGGSYWLHYLVATVPGLALAAAVGATAGPVRRVALGVVLGYAAVVALGAVVVTAVSPVGTPAPDLAVERYLSAHARPGDTGTIAFGDPALLQAAGLSSPYPELWSLPVRVRDPDLTQLTQVLRSSDRPTWLVVDGTSLATWGVDAAGAQQVMDEEYRLAHEEGDWQIFHVRTAAAHR